MSVVVMWFAVKDAAELSTAVGKMPALSVEGRIKPGIYFVRPGKRLHRDALVELAMVKADTIKELTHALSIDGVIDRGEGAVVVRVPPWGLWGESFDIGTRLNAKLIKES